MNWYPDIVFLAREEEILLLLDVYVMVQRGCP
jgi:hypothetical protein